MQTPNWGDDCGTVRASERDKAGTVYRHVRGGAKDGQVIPAGKGRFLFGKGVCARATGMPGLKETVSGPRILCRSPANASHQVSGKITKSVNGEGQLAISHHFDYEWRLKGTHCRVSTRGRWTFEGQSRSAKQPRSKPACTQPGPIARLVRLDPPNLSVDRGATKSLRVRAVDKNGCRISTAVSWQATAGTISADGVLDTTDVPRGQRVEVVATAGKAKALFVVSVGAKDDPLPALTVPATTATKTSELRYGAEVTFDAGGGANQSTGPLLVVGLVTLLAGIAGTVALRRRRRD